MEAVRATVADVGRRLRIPLVTAAAAILASGAVHAQPTLKLQACFLIPGCSILITTPFLGLTHENGFTQSTDPFPDDTGNGLTILPANPPDPPLAYSGTPTNPGIGESSATFGGSYKISPGPVNFNRFEFIPPLGGKFTLSQTDLSATPNGPAVTEGTLAVPVMVVSGAGEIEVFSDFDIVTTITGMGSVSIELNICSIKNWLDAPATDFPKTQADCLAEGGKHLMVHLLAYTSTVI